MSFKASVMEVVKFLILNEILRYFLNAWVNLAHALGKFNAGLWRLFIIYNL